MSNHYAVHLKLYIKHTSIKQEKLPFLSESLFPHLYHKESNKHLVLRGDVVRIGYTHVRCPVRHHPIVNTQHLLKLHVTKHGHMCVSGAMTGLAQYTMASPSLSFRLFPTTNSKGSVGCLSSVELSWVRFSELKLLG